VPTGWTKDTTFNDAMIRVVSGTPSSRVSAGNEITTLMTATRTAAGTVDGHAITIAEMPPHNHSYNWKNFAAGSGTAQVPLLNGSAVTQSENAGFTILNNGSGATHNHTFTSNAMNFAINYADMYIATKN
jgi:hypothetical protein